MQNNPNKIIIHHSADNFQGDQFWKINEWHKHEQFFPSKNGIYVGYHELIEKNGVVKKARQFDEIGQHCTGQNNSSIGICLAGNFDTERPNKKQINALADRLAEIMNEYKIKITEIYPHRHFANKSCYGRLLDNNWARYVALQGQLNIIVKILLWIQIKLSQL